VEKTLQQNAKRAIRILLLEDSPEDARRILELLGEADGDRVQPTWVERVPDALHHLASHEMDLAMVDYESLAAQDLEMFHRAEGMGIVPVIFLCDLDHERSAAHAVKGNVHDYLVRERLTRDLLMRSIRYALKLEEFRKALREYERRARAIFDLTFEFIGLMSPDGTLLEANRTSLAFTGVKSSEVLGKPFWETPWWSHSPEMQQRLREAVKEAAGGKLVRFEATHQAPDGTLLSIDFSLKPIHDEKGHVIFLIPEGRDVTERKRTEEALRQSEETASALLNALSDRAFLLDTKGNILAVNKPGAEALGNNAALHVGKNLFEFLPPEVAGKQRAYFRQVVLSGTSIRFNDIRDGLWLDTSMHPVFDAEGKTLTVAVFARDLTEEKRMEKALLQREKLKTLGAISAEVAHEIRNPLVAIGGFARRLQEKTPDLAEAGIIVNESQRLERILGRIRDYLKPIDIQMKKSSINEILRNCINLLSPQLIAKRVRCVLDIAPGPVEANVDPEILGQVFINLIRNAIESTEEGKTLAIQTSEKGSQVQIAFRHPPSRPIKDADLLFLPFDEGGHSIGLPLSYRLLKDMGGLLSAEKQEDQIVFTLSLPKSGPEPDEGKRPGDGEAVPTEPAY
jgi:PAS domain S-box-containing protein